MKLANNQLHVIPHRAKQQRLAYFVGSRPVKKSQRLAIINSQHTSTTKSTSNWSSLKESFSPISVLQHPQKSGTVRVPIEIGSVALALSLRQVLFGAWTHVR